MAKLKTYKFVEDYFFSINFLHAHLQYVYNIYAKCCKDQVKALRGLDFSKYVLSTIIYYAQSS